MDVSGASAHHEMVSKAATCVAVCLLLCVSDCSSQELGNLTPVAIVEGFKRTLIASYVCLGSDWKGKRELR